MPKWRSINSVPNDFYDIVVLNEDDKFTILRQAKLDATTIAKFRYTHWMYASD